MTHKTPNFVGCGDNIFVKIPITNNKKESSADLISSLTAEGIKLNVTVISMVDQVAHLVPNLNSRFPSIVAVFARRVANTGVNPIPMMVKYKKLLANNSSAKLL